MEISFSSKRATTGKDFTMNVEEKGATFLWIFRFITVVTILACLASLALPWYQETVNFESLDPDKVPFSTGTVFYQLFYFYVSQECNSTEPCNIRYEAFLADIPKKEGISVWPLESDSSTTLLTSTRTLFLLSWIFQLFALISLLFVFSSGSKISTAACVALISSAASLVLFFLLPSALQRDYGDTCTGLSGLLPDYMYEGDTPCTRLFYSVTIDNVEGSAFLRWMPSFGFFFGMGNVLLHSFIFLSSACLYPCICTSPTPLPYHPHDSEYLPLLSESDNSSKEEEEEEKEEKEEKEENEEKEVQESPGSEDRFLLVQTVTPPVQKSTEDTYESM